MACAQLKLKPITDLHASWPWVRNGLNECFGKTGERSLPEDVYVAIKSGTSFLFALDHGGKDVGFTVLQQHMDSDGPCLFIWAMWCQPGHARANEPEVYAALEAKAAEVGAKRLRMWSPRKAWEREPYWRQVSAIYEHEVTR